jgi:anti-anti-sigma regulatory factor
MTYRFELPAELTIFSVAQTQVALLDWLAGQGAEPDRALEVGASQVLDLDGAGVQLVCALSALLARKGWAWRLVEPTSTFTQACCTLGLTDWLDRHSVAEAA